MIVMLSRLNVFFFFFFFQSDTAVPAENKLVVERK